MINRVRARWARRRAAAQELWEPPAIEEDDDLDEYTERIPDRPPATRRVQVIRTDKPRKR